MIEKTDAVAQARQEFLNALYADLVNGTHTADAKLDALIAAVRAECADRVRALDNVYPQGDAVSRLEALAALEAK